MNTISPIIEDLYDGTLDPTSWKRAMIGIADLVSGVCTCLISISPARALVLRDEVYRYDPETLAQYRRVWVAKDPRLIPTLRHGVGEAMFEGKLLPVASWKRSEIYNDFLLPADTPWFLAFWLHKSADKVVTLSVQGSARRGPFQESDGERVQPILPHVQRALAIKDKLDIAEVNRATLVNSLDQLECGVLLLDSEGKLLEANKSAEECYLRPGVVMRRRTDGTVWIKKPVGEQLDQWILGGRPPDSIGDGLLRIPRPNARPLSLLATRLPETYSPWTSVGGPCWVVLIFDPDRRVKLSTQLIETDLGVSPRESEVVALLVEGYDLVTIAERLKISVHTARTHLKSVFAKVDVRSQNQLITRVMTGTAAVLRGPR